MINLFTWNFANQIMVTDLVRFISYDLNIHMVW
jgi:hypothetical protein